MKHQGAKIKQETLTLIATPLAFAVICGLVQWFNYNDWASLDVEATLSGQWWRIITGHLVHSGWQHYAMNMVGLGLCIAVFYKDVRGFHWPLSFLVLSLFSSIGLIIIYPSNYIYIGFSDVLHGWIMLGCIAIYKKEKKLSIAVFVLFWLKIIEENLNLPFFTSFGVSGNVAKESHILGATAGIIYALIAFKP
ncbi:MAG: rhombosortase, partial [Sinobacterium sp.]|nr:rhombosortase [Sinobacterium sp.]